MTAVEFAVLEDRLRADLDRKREIADRRALHEELLELVDEHLAHGMGARAAIKLVAQAGGKFSHLWWHAFNLGCDAGIAAADFLYAANEQSTRIRELEAAA